MLMIFLTLKLWEFYVLWEQNVTVNQLAGEKHTENKMQDIFYKIKFNYCFDQRKGLKGRD